MRDLERDGRPPSALKLYDDPAAEQTSGRYAKQASARPPSSPARTTRTRAGKIPRSRPSTSADYTPRLDRARRALRLREPSTAITAGLRPRPLELRPRDETGRSRRCAAGSTRRLDLVVELGGTLLGRARRRPGAAPSSSRRCRRALVGRSRSSSRSGIPLEDESRQGAVRPNRIDENLRLGAARPVATAGEVLVFERWRRLRARDRPLRRRWEVPHARRRQRHLPVFMGRGRRGCARTSGHARLLFETARRRGHHRRLAVRRGDGGPRPLPSREGLHARLPGERRHARVQGGVPPPPLEPPPAPAPARTRSDSSTRSARVASRAPGLVNFLSRTPAVRARCSRRRPGSRRSTKS